MELAGVGILGAFVAGIVSFLSPCVLPLVPGYVSYIAGESCHASPAGRARPPFPALLLSVFFVFGFTTVFALLGASATFLGQLLLSLREELNLVGGVIVVVFGLFTMGFMRPMGMMRELRFHSSSGGGRPLSAYVLGLAFAFGWTPCIGPILGSILTVSAGSATVSQGVALLVVYSAGLGMPFLGAAYFSDSLSTRLRKLRGVGRRLQIIAGMVMVAMGVAMITGYLPMLAYWLLDLFPGLASIG